VNHDLIVASDNESIIGFISGSSNYPQLMKEARRSISLLQLFRILRTTGIFGLTRMVLDWIILNFKFKMIEDFYYFSSWGIQRNTHSTAGALLFIELLKRAKFSSKTSIVTNVSLDNLKVIRMYQSLDFVIIGKSLNEVILRKVLK
jgi:hypothetical protein